ncbi:MAG: ATP synthase F1 subunit delta [Flavobacteriales bacterium]
MKSSKSAGRYAKALLELALDQNKVEQIEADMLQLINLANEAHDFHVLINSPLIQIEKKISIIKEIFKNFNETSLNLLVLVTQNGREGALIEIAKQFIDLLMAHRGIVPVTIISAATLEEKTKADILSKINSAVNGTPKVTEIVDPSIIGGFIVRIGDQQIDASVANQLQRMKQQLV